MADKKVKIALVGAGHVAQIAHLPAYKIHPNAELVALVEEDPIRRNKLKKMFGFKRGYEDITRMLSREDVDAVDICTPNYLHAPMAIAALRSGRHVLCEKPLARNAIEGKKMVDMAKESGKMLMVAMNNRFRKDVHMLRTFVKRGELGDVQMVKVGWQRIARDWRQRRWFMNQRMAGGGALLDLGLPLMDLAIWIAGLRKPTRVSCSVFGRSGKRGVEDSACAMVSFAGGACLTIEVTWNLLEPKDHSYLEIYGSRGGASLHPFKIHKAMHGHLVNVTPTIDDVRHYYKASYQAEINHFIECILKKKRPLTTGRDALSVLKILDAMYESESVGEEVKFTS
ncbi:MAG: Gfo/Idh/MocA family oxidoreductase [Candidatus Latescibacterota bacterium]|nr:MAG: Gfo/Idh/MocA family oxidoreductase [Candidatus Latescibacterota bacterium]